MDGSAKPRQLESVQFNIREVFVNEKLDKETFCVCRDANESNTAMKRRRQVAEL
jgi:hypothetical protein